MGVLAPGFAHARPSAQPPIDTSEKISPHVSGTGGQQIWNISDQFSRHFRDSKHFSFFFPKKPPKRWPPRGAGGSLKLFFYPKSYFFCDLKPYAKFGNPTITPSGRKVTVGERTKKEEKTPLIVNTYFCDSARKPLGPKLLTRAMFERRFEIEIKEDWLRLLQLMYRGIGKF